MARQIKIAVLSRQQQEARFISEHPDAFRESVPTSKPVAVVEVQRPPAPGYGPADGAASIGIG